MVISKAIAHSCPAKKPFGFGHKGQSSFIYPGKTAGFSSLMNLHLYIDQLSSVV
jgi:hypothetical protein